jgi:hypothetical protein
MRDSERKASCALSMRPRADGGENGLLIRHRDKARA